MSTMTLTPQVVSIGVANPAMRIFDIVMHAEYGTTYNAYAVLGEHNVLIDTVHTGFFEEYLDNLRQVAPVEQFEYLVVNHTELDHSGAIARLLDLNPNLTILCTAPAKKYLTTIINKPFQCRVVKHGETLPVGPGELRFVVAPFLHWPDSMMTYLDTDRVLFSCDFLGAHFCEPQLLDTKVHYPDKYESCFRYYYDCIFGPFKPYVLAGLDKIEDLDLAMVCPSHGPMLTERIDWARSCYRDWSAPADKPDKKQVLILYAAAYGCTRQLAEAAAEALKDDYDVTLMDMVTTPLSEVAGPINACDALLVGTNTINRDATPPVWATLSAIDAVNAGGKPAGVFGSFGWSGEAIGMVVQRLTGLRMKVVGEGYRVNFVPTEAELEGMRAYAREVAAGIKG